MVQASNVIIPSQPVPSLTRWGVSAHADLVYRALATLGSQSVSGLSNTLGLPRRKARLALDELHGLDAAVPSRATNETDDRIWQCRRPEHVVSALRKRQELLVKARYQLQRNLSLLDISGIAPEELQNIRLIHGVPATRLRLAELMAAERSEHLAMNPEPAFSAASAKAGIPTARAVLQRGVATWTLGVPADEEDESDSQAQELFSYGLEYRELPQQPTKLMIMDRKTAFVPLDPALNFSRGVWEVTSQPVVDRLVAFFMDRWNQAASPQQGWVPPTALNQREHTIIALLAIGDTDALAAEKLGISVRTIAYTLKELMDRHSVQNRFQLGLVLGKQSMKKKSKTES